MDQTEPQRCSKIPDGSCHRRFRFSVRPDRPIVRATSGRTEEEAAQVPTDRSRSGYSEIACELGLYRGPAGLEARKRGATPVATGSTRNRLRQWGIEALRDGATEARRRVQGAPLPPL